MQTTIRLIHAALAVVLLAGDLAFAQAPATQVRGLQPTDFYSEVTIEDVAIRPQGDLVAFTVMTIVEKDNTRHREIWMQPLEAGAPGGDAFRFTSATEESTGPRWSPDGTLLAFTSKRGDDKNSTWFMRVDAPGGEAFHVEGVDGAPVWSPDGRWIAFLKTPDEETKAAGSDGDGGGDTGAKAREGWIAPGALTRTLDAKRFDGRVITSMRYKSNGTLTWLPDPATRRKAQIFVVAAAGGDPRQVTDLAFAPSQLTWLADNATILFTGDERQDDEYNVDSTSDLYAVVRTGGAPRLLTTNPGSERSAAVSPKGDRLAYLFSKERGAETDVLVVDIAADGTFTSTPRNLTAAWDRQPGAPEWLPDGRGVRFGPRATATRTSGKCRSMRLSCGR